MKKKLRIIIPIILLFFLLFSIVIAVMIGTVEIEFTKIIGIILHKIGFSIPVNWTQGEENIILILRLPRVLMAVVIGIMLAVSGAAAQGLFRNPIADPYILGISSSASCGVALIIVMGSASILGIFTIPIISFIFSLISVFIVYRLSITRYQISIIILILAGVAISYFFSSLTSLILFFAEDTAHLILFYLMGGFYGANWIDLFLVYCIMVFGVIILFYYGRDLNTMVFGDEIAQSMGVNVEKSKRIILVIMTLLTSTAVAFCGSIGFVGLIIPQIMRLLVGNDNRKLIPLSALGGALLLLWADLFARSLIPPLEIPVGIFTSIMGGPFFVYLIIKKKKSGELI